MNWQNRFSWFRDWVGVDEQEFLTRRHEFLEKKDNGHLAIIRSTDQKKWDAGNFDIFSIATLLQTLSNRQENIRSQNCPQFEIVVRTTDEAIPHVDVAYLQSRAKPHSMFQVASNFNCAEVPSPWTDMSGGRFVSNNALDLTQGPAASAGAGISLITRIHAPFFEEQTDSHLWGQNFEQQIELLGDEGIREHFPVRNGKLIFEQTEPLVFEPTEEVFESIRIGLHQKAPVYFGRREGSMMEIVENPPIIDQVFVAALNHRAPLPYANHLDVKTDILLRAAYEGTYLAAILQKSEHLVLTLIGGGSFANPFQNILRALAQAHQKWSPLSSLKTVQLPIFSLHASVEGSNIAQLAVQELRDIGIPKDCISVVYRDVFVDSLVQ